MPPLPRYERVLFRHSPLRIVIGQVRFPVLFRFREKPFLAGFQEAIKAEYPRVAEENPVSLKLSASGVEQTGDMLWRFSDRADDWSVVLGENALTLETRGFAHIDEFLERFERLVIAAREDLGVEERTRLGLRFVNEFRIEGANTLSAWGRLLNDRFVGYGGSDLLDGSAEVAFQDVRFKRDDGLFAVRHGLLAGTTVIVQPRAGDPPQARAPFYIVDLDYFDEREGALDIGETIRQLREYNDIMYRFFRWTLDGGTLYDRLGPQA